MPDSHSRNSPEPKFDAFLSYNSADRPVVRRIQRFLESYRPPNRNRPLAVYLDETDMYGGSLPENLSQALADSGALVVCWSDKAAGSPWVNTEIRQFRELGHEHRIAIVHVGGPGPTVNHEAFTGLEPVEHDLRKGWRAWFLTPKAKLELLRLIAFLTGADMRMLRNWALRRTFRRALISMGAALLPLAGLLFLSLPSWDLVPLSHHGQPIKPLACEVVDGKLWVASWYEAAGIVSGARAYFVTYPDVLNNVEDKTERAQFFSLSKRALPINRVPEDLKVRVRSVLDLNPVKDQLKGLSDPDVPRIAEPGPDRFLYIRPFGTPDRQEVINAAMDHSPQPETTGVLIVAYEKGNPPRVNTVAGFAPPRWQNRPEPEKRRTPPSREMSVVWQQNGEIWLGVPSEREIPGGLWHSLDAGNSWQREIRFFNVTSLDIRSTSDGKSETVIVAEQSFKKLHGLENIPGESQMWERASDGSWIPSDTPPHGTDSEIEMCGSLPGDTIYVRVDKQIYKKGTRPLYRFVTDVWGSL